MNMYNYDTRGRGNLDVKYCKTKVKSRPISIKGVILWNNVYEIYHQINCLSVILKKSIFFYISNYNA